MASKLRRLFLLPALLLLWPLHMAWSQPQASLPEMEARVNSMLAKLTLEEKIDLIGGVDGFYVRASEKIGLPRLKMADGPVGVRNYGPSTVFGGIGLAAAWDPELASRIGATIGQDARARGVYFMLGPGVNIYRAPLNGRNFEYFGEDPFLSARTAVAYITGMQSQGVSATIKHFMGNNSEFDRHNTDSIIDERTMREIYLPVFEAAVKEAHVGAIMDSYNLTNGQHMTQNGPLNNDLVKKEWGFSGIIMSDWDATYDAVAAANGGLDLEMPSGKFMNRQSLLPAIKAGTVREATIDDKVRRILRTAIQFGWLDHDQTDSAMPLLNPAGKQTTLEAARAGMVLLKNDRNILPLEKGHIKSIAVIGPDAYPAQPAGGGSADAKSFTPVSFLEGISNYLGDSAKVYYAPGIPTLDEMARQTQFTTDAAGGKKGLKMEIFDNVNLTGPPAMVRDEQHVHYEPAREGDVTNNNISIRWTGFFTPSVPGQYLAFVQGPGESGGYRLYIDKKLVLDNWTQWYAFVGEVPVTLAAGPHEIEMDYRAERVWGKAVANLGIVRPETLVSAEAKTLAARADAVIIAAGFNPESEGESGDRMFRLPPAQDELINQIAEVSKNTIVVVTSGGGVDMAPWVDHIPALLEAWYPGQQGGDALAQILFGEFNPSGRLPISIERRWEDNASHDSYYPKAGSKKVEYSEKIFIGYRHFDKSSTKPLFPFGYGLSYTSFAYKNLMITPLSQNQQDTDQQVTLTFDVTNTGARAGADIAEIFVGDHHAPVPRPVKELKGFAKVNLTPGETKTVTVKLDRRAFSYFDVNQHAWTLAPGDFDLFVARSAADIELTGKVALH
jgi:beta-glucosidase